MIRLIVMEAKLVHSDLSEYNIMHTDSDPIIFDMAQSVHIDHPNAKQFLLRDLNTLNRFFKMQGVLVKEPESLYKRVTGDE